MDSSSIFTWMADWAISFLRVNTRVKKCSNVAGQCWLVRMEPPFFMPVLFKGAQMSNLCVNSVNSDAHCDRHELTDKRCTNFKIHKRKVKITSTTKKQRLERVFCSMGKTLRRRKAFWGKAVIGTKSLKRSVSQ